MLCAHQVGEAFSLANQAAAAAAQLPLPPEDEAAAEAPTPQTGKTPAAAAEDTPETFAADTSVSAPSTAGGGGWGAALLQTNKAAASAAATAVQAAIDEAAAGSCPAHWLPVISGLLDSNAHSRTCSPHRRDTPCVSRSVSPHLMRWSGVHAHRWQQGFSSTAKLPFWSDDQWHPRRGCHRF